MSSNHMAGPATTRVSIFAICGLFAALAMLIVSSVAMGAADPLKSGTTTLSLKLPGGVKLGKASGGATKSGKIVTLQISGGSLDPTTGSGAVQNGGKLQLKAGGKKATLSNITTGFGGGSLSAKLGKGKAKKLATLSGGTAGRSGFGGTVTGASAKLTKGGAKALNSALGTSKFKKGKKLGTASTTTTPKTVQVTGGTQVAHAATGFGKLIFTAPTLAGSGKGVDPVPGSGVTGSGGTTYTTPGGAVTSPVTSGSAAPDGSAGSLSTAGALKITKSQSILASYASCPEDASHWPIGNFFQVANATNDLTHKVLAADVTLQAPPVTMQPGPVAFGNQLPEGTLDVSAAAASSNATAKTIDITGIKVIEGTSQAQLLGGIFGTSTFGCGAAGTDPAVGDTFVTLDLHLTTH